MPPPKPPLPTSKAIETVIATVEERKDRNYASAFRKEAEAAQGVDWSTLGQIFDFLFKPRNDAEPFGPMAVVNGKRSMIPADLTDEQLDQLQLHLAEINDAEFRARVGDVLWIRRRDPDAARVAIEAYLESGSRLEDPKRWTSSMERYERAVRLARQLGKKERLSVKALSHIEARVRHYNGSDPLWFSYRGLSLLYEFRHGAPDEFAALAGKIAEAGRSVGDLRKARKHFELRAKFLLRAGDKASADAARTAAAETHIGEAERSEADGSYLAAHTFWENAVKAFRKIPGGKARVPELHRRLNNAGERMLDEMQTISTEFSVEEQAKVAKAAVEGLSFNEGIFTLVSIYPMIDPDRLKEEAEENLKESPIRAILAASIMDAAGRKVGVRPSAFTDDPQQLEEAIKGFMFEFATWHRVEVVHGYIAPAMRQILEEHLVEIRSFEALLDDSGFIPEGRIPLFAQGITLGFEWDFSTALHILLPQIENSLRHLLHQHKVITTSLDDVGIEEAWPLGRILSCTELEGILGSSFVFELRSLLVDRLGANFRNVVSHGLLDPGTLNSETAFYIWWLILRLVVMPTPQFQCWVNATESE